MLLKAKENGLNIKIHADEIERLGGAELAAEIGAVSADHLLQASDKGIHSIAKAGVIATLLPGTALYMNIGIEEAITALTINGAAALGRADTIGSLDIGKYGDVIILKDPSYQFIPYHVGISTVEKVIKRGRLVFDGLLPQF